MKKDEMFCHWFIYFKSESLNYDNTALIALYQSEQKKKKAQNELWVEQPSYIPPIFLNLKAHQTQRKLKCLLKRLNTFNHFLFFSFQCIFHTCVSYTSLSPLGQLSNGSNESNPLLYNERLLYNAVKHEGMEASFGDFYFSLFFFLNSSALILAN